jgi:hypothetical protein
VNGKRRAFCCEDTDGKLRSSDRIGLLLDMHHILLMQPNPQQDTHDPASVHPVPQVKALPPQADNDDAPIDSSPNQRRGVPTWVLVGLAVLSGVLTVAWVLLLLYALAKAVIWLFT